MNITAVILILGGGVVLTVGDVVMKYWVDTNRTLLWVIGISIYIVGLMFLAASYRYENIAVATAAMEVGNVVAITIVSYLYFHNSLTTWQILGIVLGIASVVILEFHR